MCVVSEMIRRCSRKQQRREREAIDTPEVDLIKRAHSRSKITVQSEENDERKDMARRKRMDQDASIALTSSTEEECLLNAKAGLGPKRGGWVGE